MIHQPTAPNLSEVQSQPKRNPAVFLVLWVLSSVFFGWLLITKQIGFTQPLGPVVLVTLIAIALALLWLIPTPIPTGFEAVPTKKGLLSLLIFTTCLVLFVSPVLFGTKILYALPVLSLAALALLRRGITPHEGLYALVLTVIATVAGLAMAARQFIGFSPVGWAVMQILLVLPSFLAGWKILQHTGLINWNIGDSRFLRSGLPSALRGFGQGMLLSIPWSLASVIMGGAANDNWVTEWWQPFSALQPGIAEEAWGRLLVIPLLFLLFRVSARPRTAFTAAVLCGTFWFAYLHTQTGITGIFSTLLIGITFGLPIAYLCLYRDLETAIGFHFMVDFVRFLSALLLVNAVK